MITMQMPRIADNFTMTQVEADAVALLTRRPYYDGQDMEFLARVMSFMARYVSLKGEPEPSREACELLEQCFVVGDYRKLDRRTSECRSTIDKMIERATK